jgi:hypothetical protein
MEVVEVAHLLETLTLLMEIIDAPRLHLVADLVRAMEVVLAMVAVNTSQVEEAVAQEL